jgi:hypothetical protein
MFLPDELPLKATQAVRAKVGEKPQAIPSTIEQTERLFTIRSRNVNYQTGGGDRGQHTFIQLLSSKKEGIVSSHTGEGFSKPTSLGTDTKGPLADAIRGKYGEFLLTDIQGSLDEKLQVTEVMGDAEIVYYFGRQPIHFQFQGLLIDSPDNNWFIQWVEMYANVFRGTELARNYELIKVITPNMSFIGSISNMGYSQNSARDTDIPFQFTMMVKQIIPNAVMVPGKPSELGLSINPVKAEGFKTMAEIVSQRSAAAKLINTIKNPASTLKDYAGAMIDGSMGKDTSSGISSLLDKGTAAISSLAGGGAKGGTVGVSSLFSNVTSNLSGVRASLFSPVYGVLSSLTKLIKSAGGLLNNVIGSFTNPVRDILRDVRNISNQAVGVVNLINNSLHTATNQVRGLDSDLKATLSTLKKTAGVISSAPQTITSHMRDLLNSGRLPASTAYLRNSGPVTLNSNGTRNSKIFLLNSGPKHTPEKGARL